ncbi:MAG TPA: ribonuclease III, partial [Telluria sp.]|nr:ribonuclease III [Telluria sp.]
DVAGQALLKSPAGGRKPRPRAAQLKLAGIATIQGDGPDEGEGAAPAAAPAPVKTAASTPETKAPKHPHPETKSA